jgi:hypothetical protein
MKRKVLETIHGWLDASRFVAIPAGEIIEATSYIIAGRVPIHWKTVTEGQGYVLVDQDELESCSVRI